MKNKTKGELLVIATVPTFFVSWKIGLVFICLCAAISLVIKGLEKI